MFIVSLVSFVCIVAGGCKDQSAERSQAGKTPNAQPAARRSARAKLRPYRPLLDEVSRAELDAGGIVVDFGDASQMKYTRGGWRTGWGTTTAAAGDTPGSAAISERRAWLDLVVPTPAPAAIVVRARSSVSDQKIALRVGDTILGTFDVGDTWTTGRVAIAPGKLPAGPVRLALEPARSGEPRAEIDWLWLPRAADADQPLLAPRAAPMTVGGKARRALIAPDARTYSFYIQPPPGAHLVVDLGATEQATFEVTATTDGGAPISLLREDVRASWVEGAVSLAAFAGKPIRLDLTTRDQTGAVGWGEPELLVETAAPPPAPTATGRPKNVIVILMDTARADGYSPFAGADRTTRTPSYDALVARGTTFVGAYNNENWTKPSVATTLSGLYPTTHDAKEDASELSRDVELLSERLQKDGFATAGFVANGYVSDKFGFEQGWGTFRNYIREGVSSAARYVYADALAWLDEHAARAPDQPFFLYVQTIDAHVTYSVGEEFWRPYYEGTYKGPLGDSITADEQVKLSKQARPDDDDVRWLRALYWGEVSYHDDHMGKFLAALDERGLDDNTLLVVTNDHGEELGERGRFGHGHQVFEEMIRAPLLMAHDGVFPRGHRVTELVEHVDLAPTIVDALGLEPLANADGASFLPLVQGRPFQRPRYTITEFLHGRRVVRVGTLKMVTKVDGTSELFDLAADPSEQTPLADAAIARRLCQVYLGEGLGSPDKKERMRGVAGRRQYRAGKAQISGAVRRQLEALGYFGDQEHDEDEK